VSLLASKCDQAQEINVINTSHEPKQSSYWGKSFACVMMWLAVLLPFDLQGRRNHAAGPFSSQLVQSVAIACSRPLRTLQRSDDRHHRRAFPRPASPCVRILSPGRVLHLLTLVPQLLTMTPNHGTRRPDTYKNLRSQADCGEYVYLANEMPV